MKVRSNMDNLKSIIESILFVSGDGIEIYEIADKLNLEEKEVEKAINELKEDHVGSGIQVITYNKKVQLCSNPDNATYVTEVLNPIKEKQMTRAVLEVAAIIAYKQPITRLDIENVRGVNSDYAISMLLENQMIEVVGRKDAIGKPLLFGTTDGFLKRFGLQSIEELPDYEELLSRIEVIHKPKEEASLFDFEKPMDINQIEPDNTQDEEDQVKLYNELNQKIKDMEQNYFNDEENRA